MIDRTEYTPYGSIIATAATQNIGDNYKYTGKELDSETNLSYYGARYYNQTVGRFMTIDPYGLQLDKIMKVLSDPQSLNGYTYTRNNPIILVDPDGNQANIFQYMAWGFQGIGEGILSTLSSSFSAANQFGSNPINGSINLIQESRSTASIQFQATEEFTSKPQETTIKAVNGFLNQPEKEQAKAVGQAAFATALALEGGLRSGTIETPNINLKTFKNGFQIEGERFAVGAKVYPNVKGVGVFIRDLEKSSNPYKQRIFGIDWHGEVPFQGEKYNLPHLHVGSTPELLERHWPWER